MSGKKEDKGLELVEKHILKRFEKIKKIRKENSVKNKKNKEKDEEICKYGCGDTGIILDKKTHLAKRCKCVRERNLARRLAFANIPKEFEDLAINQFDLSLYKKMESQKIALTSKNMTVKYVNKFEKFNDMGKGLYFYSHTKGSGKTRLAISCANALSKVHNVPVKYINTIDLLNEIKKTYGDDSKVSEGKIIEDLKRVEVLILDDIGVERMSPWVADIFYNLINGRLISKKVTFFTSNVKIEELKHGDRIKNRIENMALPLKMPEESVRTTLSRKQNEDMIDELLE